MPDSEFHCSKVLGSWYQDFKRTFIIYTHGGHLVNEQEPSELIFVPQPKRDFLWHSVEIDTGSSEMSYQNMNATWHNGRQQHLKHSLWLRCGKQEDHNGPLSLPCGTKVDIWIKDTNPQYGPLLYGHGGHLGKQIENIWINFLSSNPRRLKMKYDHKWPRGLIGEVIWRYDLDTKV